MLACDPDAPALAAVIGSAAIRLLREQMAHTDSRVRLSALYCVVRIGGREAIEICVDALQDDEACVRLRAIREICDNGDRSLVPRLIKALAQWSDEQTRRQLALAIGKLDVSHRTIPELRRQWKAERSGAAEEAFLVALSKLGDKKAQHEFVLRFRACCGTEGLEFSVNAPALRFFDYANYIHDRWLIEPLAALLTNTRPLIRLRDSDPANRRHFVRVCDLALTLAGSIARTPFGFPIDGRRIFTAEQRLRTRNRLLDVSRSGKTGGQRLPDPADNNSAEIQAVLRLGNRACKNNFPGAQKSGRAERDFG